MDGPNQVIELPLHVRQKAHVEEHRAFATAFEHAAQAAIRATFKRKLPVPVAPRWADESRSRMAGTDTLLEP